MSEHMTDRAAEHWASRHVEHARKDTRSDAEVAGDVRMLTRSDLMHEFKLVRARDRIALLSYEANHAAAIVAQLADARAQNALLRAAIDGQTKCQACGRVAPLVGGECPDCRH